MNTISDLQLDNKRLQERNQHLLQQVRISFVNVIITNWLRWKVSKKLLVKFRLQILTLMSNLKGTLLNDFCWYFSSSHQQTLNQLDVIKKENTELSQKC